MTVDATVSGPGCHTFVPVVSNTGGMKRYLRYSGVAAVATAWTTLLSAAAVSGFDLLGPDPLSYMGSDPRVATLFTIGLAVPAVLFAAFCLNVRRRYPVPTSFAVVMLAGLFGQMVAAFVPIGGDPTDHRIHTTFALALGISLPLLMWRFAAGQAPGPWRRLAYRLFFLEAAACVAGLYLSARSIAPVAEILPGIAFHVWVFVVTFRSPPETRPDSLPAPVRAKPFAVES